MKIALVFAGWGSWVKPLIKELIQRPNIEVFAIFTGLNRTNDCACKVYSLNLAPQDMKGDMGKSTFRKYEKIIREISPDIIQVFGTENNFGQLGKYLDNIPVVVHLQGILTSCSSFSDCFLHYEELRRYRSLKNYLGFGGIIIKKQVKQNEKAELEILKNNKYFFGRTRWDYYTLYFNNKDALYYHDEELLRDVFYQNRGSWKLNKINRHTVFMPSGFSPVKGLHLAIETIALLKRDYPDVILYVPGVAPKYLYGTKWWRYIRGECYMNYLVSKVRKYNLQDNIVLIGLQNEEGMMNYMRRSHIFLSPSVIDNSPNAVGEAMMIGIPVVASYVGGIPSFLEDGKSCLFASSGDPYMMAAAIKRLFDDDILAETISCNALKVAQRRHDKNEVTNHYVNIFQEVINDFQNKKESK